MSKWQPIETAPPDAYDVILVCEANTNNTYAAVYCEDGDFPYRIMDTAYKDCTNYIRKGVLTHWMPLPPPPAVNAMVEKVL